jgi:hypothetical protein
MSASAVMARDPSVWGDLEVHRDYEVVFLDH